MCNCASPHLKIQRPNYNDTRKTTAEKFTVIAEEKKTGQEGRGSVCVPHPTTRLDFFGRKRTVSRQSANLRQPHHCHRGAGRSGLPPRDAESRPVRTQVALGQLVRPAGHRRVTPTRTCSFPLSVSRIRSQRRSALPARSGVGNRISGSAFGMLIGAEVPVLRQVPVP